MARHRTWTMDGRKSHPLYKTWRGIINRCYYKNSTMFKYYGGRGIKLCDRWYDPINGFFNFVNDMGERPNGRTLDRIDPNGDYSPENCRWATKFQQQNNRNKKSATGVVGITYTSAGTYLAEVYIGRKDNRIRKTFKTLKDAVSWREGKLKEYGIKKD